VPNGYTRSPRLLKGALVELSQPFLGPVPNAIAFQYNPETLSRKLSPWKAPGTIDEEEEGKPAAATAAPSTAQPYDPGESFTLTLVLDASDAMEQPDSHPVAARVGVAERIAALEMLLYPLGDSLLGDAFARLGGDTEVVPRGSVPVVLFVWGPGRVVPVRLTSFNVEEQAFNPALYPIRAVVKVGLRVLTADTFHAPDKKLGPAERLAVSAYDYTRKQKEVLARANLLNTAESAVGMLPI
jgi:Contractile injection system tube protein